MKAAGLMLVVLPPSSAKSKVPSSSRPAMKSARPTLWAGVRRPSAKALSTTRLARSLRAMPVR